MTPNEPLTPMFEEWAGPPPAVDLQSVSVWRKKRCVLNRIDLYVEEDVVLGVYGPNGGGKTALFDLILGRLAPSSGRIEVFGKRPGVRWRNRYPIGFVPQIKTIPVDFPATVFEVVLMGAAKTRSRWLPLRREYKVHARSLLTAVQLDLEMDRPIGHLSPGHLQRVLLARAMAAQPRLILMDEPFADMDKTGREHYHELILELRRQYRFALIVASQANYCLKRLCDRVVCLNKEILWDLPVDRIGGSEWNEPYRPRPLADLFDFAGTGETLLPPLDDF